MNKAEKQEIINYLTPLEFRYIYMDEAEKIRDYVITHFMGIKMIKGMVYTLGLFNAYLDDGRIKYTPRFQFRHDRRQYLEDGQPNPHYNEECWRLL